MDTAGGSRGPQAEPREGILLAPVPPPHSQSSSSSGTACRGQLPPPSSVVHEHLSLLSSRERGEKAALREGEETGS